MFKKTGDWARLARALRRGALASAFREEIPPALMDVAVKAKGHGLPKVPPPIGEMQAEIKGSEATLIDTGELVAAIQPIKVSPYEVFLGISQKSPEFPRAYILHQGGQIKVTDAMRWFFFVLWLVSEDKMDPSELGVEAKASYDRWQGWTPLREDTEYIRIPARPFMRVIFDKPGLRQLFRNRMTVAISRSIRRIVSK